MFSIKMYLNIDYNLDMNTIIIKNAESGIMHVWY